MDDKEINTFIGNLIRTQLELGNILRKLLRILVLEHKIRGVSTLDANTALAEILGLASKDNIKSLKSLRQEANIEKFYDTKIIPYKFKTSISIDDLDITCMVEILKHVDGFPTCKRGMKNKKCKNVRKGHITCCKNCDHTCGFCGKTSCSKECCGSTIDHKCKICGQHKTCVIKIIQFVVLVVFVANVDQH